MEKNNSRPAKVLAFPGKGAQWMRLREDTSGVEPRRVSAESQEV